MRHYTLPKFLARMARTFGKVYKSDNQSLLEYVMYGRFANAHINKTFRTAPFLCVTNLLPLTSYLKTVFFFFKSVIHLQIVTFRNRFYNSQA